MKIRLLALVLAALTLAGISAPSAVAAPVAHRALAAPVVLHQHHRHHRDRDEIPLRMRAWDWAVDQHGKPYEWGGTGPYGFDCSGLVYASYLHAGRPIPRTTYEMLASVDLVPTRHPQRGDLAFYGPGHVELFARWGRTFGAQQPGTLVGWHQWSRWWHPTMFFRILIRWRHRR